MRANNDPIHPVLMMTIWAVVYLFLMFLVLGYIVILLAVFFAAVVGPILVYVSYFVPTFEVIIGGRNLATPPVLVFLTLISWVLVYEAAKIGKKFTKEKV